MSGSFNQQRYLAERAAGKPIKEACFWSGIPEDEAPFIEKAIERGDLEFQPTSTTKEINQKPQFSAAETVNSTPEEISPGTGHNSGENTMADGNVAAEQLRLFIERIERLEEEKKGIADDIRDVYAEAKGQGYDSKTMREMVKLRKMEPDARAERDALIETYRNALGMLDGTPLGDFAMSRAA